MNLLMLLVALLFPVMQQGVQRVQARVEQRLTAQPAPQYHFDGRHYWCWHQGQWFVWTGATWQPQGGNR